MMKNWKKLATTDVLKGRIFKYCKVKSQSPDGTKTGDFDQIKFSNWVNIIPLTADKNVIMVKQYRHGTEKVTLEIPGGAVEMGEEDLVAATRELLEETGFAGVKTRLIGTVDANPAFQTNTCKTYLVEDCTKVSDQSLDYFEEIEVVEIPLQQINGLIKDGTISHSLVIAAFYFLL